MFMELCILSCVLSKKSLATDVDSGGAILLQATHTRALSSMPVAVVDEMGEALMQQLQSNPHEQSPSVDGRGAYEIATEMGEALMQQLQSNQTPHAGAYAVATEMGQALMQQLQSNPHEHSSAVLPETPPPPPRAAVWNPTAPLNNMPVISHEKAPLPPIVPAPERGVQGEASSPTAEQYDEEFDEDQEYDDEYDDEYESEGQFEPVGVAGDAAVGGNEKMLKVTSAGQARRQLKEHRTGCKHGVSEHEHHSIFKLPFNALDSTLFYGIFGSMLIFNICVDQLEAWLSKMAQHSKTETKLLQRVNSEMMMFGIVGLGVFIGTNMAEEISDEFFRVFEFTDILCSLGACGVIVIATVLFILRGVMERRWQVLEESLDATQDMLVAQIRQNRANTELATQRKMRQREYFVMCKKFIRQQRLHPKFCYSHYLQECLANVMCNLMDINAFSWMFLLSFSVAGLVFKAYQPKKMDDMMHIVVFCVCVWSTFVIYLYLWWDVNAARTSLRKHLDIRDSLVKLARSIDSGEEQHQQNKHEHPPHPMDKAWAWRINQMLQSLSLLTAFEGAFYVMHVGFNIKAGGFHWIWKIIILLPVVLNLGFMLPMIISRFTLVEAYFTPEHDAIDLVLTTMTQEQEDLRYLYHSWLHSGKPKFVDPGMMITFTEFSRVLKRHGMQASDERQRRLFSSWDRDENGSIDLMRVIKDLQELDQRQGSAQEEEEEEEEEE